MAYTVEGAELYDIDLEPESEEAEVIRNVSIILSTMLGSCPGYRAFGSDQSYLDKSVTRIKPLIVKEVIRAVEAWEPRAKIIDPIEVYRNEQTGKLVPKLTIEVKKK